MFKPKKQNIEIPEENFEEVDDEEEEEEEEELEAPKPNPPQKSLSKVSPKKKWSVESITTSTTPVIWNNKTEKPLTEIEALVEILNRLED
jgi:hypothetical protein